MQTRSASASSFDSPFKGSNDSTKIPSFAAYRNKGGETGPKVFQYFMVGTMGALSALGAKNTVQGTYGDTTATNCINQRARGIENA
jgi:ubiquinol-cytochrome c reductase iron-sulfur subunit